MLTTYEFTSPQSVMNATTSIGVSARSFTNSFLNSTAQWWASTFPNGEEQDLTYLGTSILVGIILSTFCFACIFGNVLVVCAVISKQYLHTPTSYLIVSMAMADLLVGCIVMPVSITYRLMGRWPFTAAWCDVWHSLDILASTASIWNLCIISLDRYLAVRDPINYREYATPNRVGLAILIVWLASGLISFPAIYWWQHKYFEPLTSVSLRTSDTNATRTTSSQYLETETFQCSLTDDVTYILFSSSVSFYIPLLVTLFAYYRVFVKASNQESSLRLGRKKVKSYQSNNKNTNKPQHKESRISFMYDVLKKRSISGGPTKSTNTQSNGNNQLDLPDDNILRIHRGTGRIQQHTLPSSRKNGGRTTFGKTHSSSAALMSVATMSVVPKMSINIPMIDLRTPARATTAVGDSGYISSAGSNKAYNNNHNMSGQVGGPNSHNYLQARRCSLALLTHLHHQAAPKDGYEHETDQELSPTSPPYYGKEGQPVRIFLRSTSYSSATSQPDESDDDEEDESVHQPHESSQTDALLLPPPPPHRPAGDDTPFFVNAHHRHTQNTKKAPIRSNDDERQSEVVVKDEHSNNIDDDQRIHHHRPLIQSYSQVSMAESLSSSTAKRHRNSSTVSYSPISFSGGGQKHERQHSNQQQSSSSNPVRRKITRTQIFIKLVKEKRAAKTLGLVVGCFVICWLPFFVVNILIVLCPRCLRYPDTTFTIVTWLGYCNSSLNPLIYSTMSRDFKRAFKEILCGARGRQRRRSARYHYANDISGQSRNNTRKGLAIAMGSSLSFMFKQRKTSNQTSEADIRQNGDQ